MTLRFKLLHQKTCITGFLLANLGLSAFAQPDNHPLPALTTSQSFLLAQEPEENYRLPPPDTAALGKDHQLPGFEGQEESFHRPPQNDFRQRFHRKNFNQTNRPLNAPEAGKMGQRQQERFGGHKQLDLTPLGLSDEQKAKIQQLREQTRDKIHSLRSELISKRTTLRNLMFSPEATEAQIRSARKELRLFQDQIDEANLNDLLSIRSFLTPEQKKRLPECMPGKAFRATEELPRRSFNDTPPASKRFN